MINYTVKIPVYREDGRPIGYVEDATLHKNVTSDRHMLQRPKGWAWDTDILECTEKQGVTRIEIHDKKSGKTYIASIQDYWDYGVGFNRGYGDQIVLPLKYWQIVNPGDHPAQQMKLSL